MRFFGWSLILHAGIAGAMFTTLGNEPGMVAGTAGLPGNLSTHFDVTMDQPRVLPPAPKVEKVKARAPLVKDGLEVPKVAEPPSELPEEMKHESPREIETRQIRSSGTTESTNIGVEGQVSTGDTMAARIGDSERSNRLGLYLQKMNRKIRSNLGKPEYLAYDTRTMLVVDLRRDGYVTKIIVTESSGNPGLDQRAIQAVKKSSPFDPWDRDERIQVPVVFDAR